MESSTDSVFIRNSEKTQTNKIPRNGAGSDWRQFVWHANRRPQCDFWDSMTLYVGQWKCGCTQAISPERVLISRYGGPPWDRGGWPSSQECNRRQPKLRQAVRSSD